MKKIALFGLFTAMAAVSLEASQFPRVKYENARGLLAAAEERGASYHHSGELYKRNLSITGYKFKANLPALDGIFDAQNRAKSRPTFVELRVYGSNWEASRGICNSNSYPSYELNLTQGRGKRYEYLNAQIRINPRTKKARIVSARSLHDTDITHSVVPKEDPTSPYSSERDLNRQVRAHTKIEKAKAWRFASFIRKSVPTLFVKIKR